MKRTLIALSCLLLFAISAYGQGGILNDNVLRADGRPAVGATVRVCTEAASGTPCSPTASIWSDKALTVSKTNPIAVDAAGGYTYYASSGFYKEQLCLGATCVTRTVLMGGDVPALVVGTSALGFSATPTFDSAANTYFSMTLTGNVTGSTISNAFDGRVIYFNICQDATGGRTFAWPASVLTPPTVGTAASSCTSASFIYDGTNWRELAASSRGSSVFDTSTIGDWNDIPVVGSDKFPATQAGLEAARDSLPATGGFVLLQEGNLNLTTNFDADNGKQNVCYIGRGSFAGADIGGFNPATSFTWTGAAGGTMVSFAPTSGASNQGLKSSCLIGVMLDAANLAAVALDIKSTSRSKFTDLFLKDCTTTCLDLDVVATLGEARDPQHNDFRNISIQNVTATSGIGIRLDGDATANSSLNRFDNINIIHDDGVGIHLIQSDTNTWTHIRVFRRPGGTGVGVLLDSTDATEHARNEYFFMLHSGAGGLTQQNDATDNVIFGYDRGNANPAPTISAGELHYIEMGVGATTWRVPEVIILRPSGTGNSVASEQLQFTGRDSGGVERTATIQADADGDLRLTPLSGKAVIIQGGINVNSGGVKHTRIASGTTAASLHATSSATWTFTTAFADTNYTIVCTIDNPTGVPLVANTDTKAAASINIVIMAGSSAAASGTLNCIAVHD